MKPEDFDGDILCRMRRISCGDPFDRRTVEVNAIPDGSGGEFTFDQFSEILAGVPEDHRATARVRVWHDRDYDSGCDYALEVVYERPETAEEMAARIGELAVLAKFEQQVEQTRAEREVRAALEMIERAGFVIVPKP